MQSLWFQIVIGLFVLSALVRGKSDPPSGKPQAADEVAQLRMLQIEHLDRISGSQSAQSGAADAKNGILIAAIIALWPYTVGAISNSAVRAAASALFIAAGLLFLIGIFMPRLRTFSSADPLIEAADLDDAALRQARDVLSTEVQNNETSLSTRDRMLIVGVSLGLLGLGLVAGWLTWGPHP